MDMAWAEQNELVVSLGPTICSATIAPPISQVVPHPCLSSKMAADYIGVTVCVRWMLQFVCVLDGCRV